MQLAYNLLQVTPQLETEITGDNSTVIICQKNAFKETCKNALNIFQKTDMPCKFHCELYC